MKGVFATNLEKIMKERGLSVLDVARLSGMTSRSTLTSLLSGATPEATLSTVFAVADGLKVDESLLVSRRVGAVEFAAVVRAYLADPISQELEPPWGPEDLMDLERRGTVFWLSEAPKPLYFHELVELARNVRRAAKPRQPSHSTA